MVPSFITKDSPGDPLVFNYRQDLFEFLSLFWLPGHTQKNLRQPVSHPLQKAIYYAQVSLSANPVLVLFKVRQRGSSWVPWVSKSD